jgi:hypothetical protein
MNPIEIINQVKTQAIESACDSAADMAFSEKTAIGIVCRGSKPMIGKFGKYEGREIVKAHTYRILSAHANKKTQSAEVRCAGRIEASATKLDWYPTDTLNEIEQRSRALLGDALYDLCEANLTSMNPNKNKWREMLVGIADWLEAAAAYFPAGEASENESLMYAARLQRRLSEAK